jgi:hypothetical protein
MDEPCAVGLLGHVLKGQEWLLLHVARIKKPSQKAESKFLESTPQSISKVSQKGQN